MIARVRFLAPALLLLHGLVGLQGCDRGAAQADQDAAVSTALRTALPGWRDIRFGMPARSLTAGDRFVASGDEYVGALKVGEDAYHVTVLDVGGQVQQIAIAPDVAGQAADARQCGKALAPLKAEITRAYGPPDNVTVTPAQLGAGEVAEWRFVDGGVILASSRWANRVCRAETTFSGAAVASGTSLTGQGGDAKPGETGALPSRLGAVP